MFAVAWHRRFLVPQESATFYVAYRWRTRHSRFLFVSISIGLLIMFGVIVPLLIGALVGPVVVVFLAASVIIGGLVGARLSLLLPATAVDDLMNFNQAWELAHRNSWRILAVFLLSAIPVGIAASVFGFLLTSLFGDAPSPPGLFVMAFTNELFGFASAALGVTVLSEAYRMLRGASLGVTTTQSET
jgi:small-conductance mechanosensitive channel